MEFISLHLLVSSLRVSPNRSQFFTSESFSLSCEVQGNSTGWKVKINKRKDEGELVPLSKKSPYIINSAYKPDSGEYWCESDSLERSNSINIIVTAGSVILESPVLPVTEGEAVTLRCRYKTTPFNLPADFYKDGSLIRTESTGNFTIYNVSKSDEGLYKCHPSDLGESPESKLVLGGPTSTFPPPSMHAIMSPFRLICHLVVASPYLLTTVVLGVKYHRRGQASSGGKQRRSDDVIMDVGT